MKLNWIGVLTLLCSLSRQCSSGACKEELEQLLMERYQLVIHLKFQLQPPSCLCLDKDGWRSTWLFWRWAARPSTNHMTQGPPQANCFILSSFSPSLPLSLCSSLFAERKIWSRRCRALFGKGPSWLAKSTDKRLPFDEAAWKITSSCLYAFPHASARLFVWV